MPYNWNNYNKPRKSYRNARPDHQPGHRPEYERNRQKILRTQDICGICGQPVDKSLKYPHPLSATVDHIRPVSKGGHPSDITNLQLAHFKCNREKWDKLQISIKAKGQGKEESPPEDGAGTDIKGLPWSLNWTQYRAPEDEENGDSNAEQLAAKAEELNRSGFIMTARGTLPKT